jgi:MFS family permease
VADCFFVNAASYLAVIAALLAMRRSELLPVPRALREPGQLRAGLRYAWHDPELRRPLLMVAVVGALIFNFSVFLPLMAHETFHSGAGTLGALYSLLGVGAITGGLLVASRGRTNPRLMAGAGAAAGAGLLIAAVMPTLPLELVAIVPLGAATIVFVASANSLLQLRSDPQMRGRVMALYGVLFLGTTPIGAPLMGVIAQGLGNVRGAMAIAGGLTLIAGLAVLRAVLRSSPAAEAEWERSAAVTALPALPATRIADPGPQSGKLGRLGVYATTSIDVGGDQPEAAPFEDRYSRARNE